MHEMSLAQSVVQIAEDAARSERAVRVRAVVLEIGRLAPVEREALAFCLDAASHGTLAEGARFTIIDIPGAGWCGPCGREVPMAGSIDPCPRCGAAPLRIVRGTEMRVTELEVE